MEAIFLRVRSQENLAYSRILLQIMKYHHEISGNIGNKTHLHNSILGKYFTGDARRREVGTP